jgi:hypothetical protein
MEALRAVCPRVAGVLSRFLTPQDGQHVICRAKWLVSRQACTLARILRVCWCYPVGWRAMKHVHVYQTTAGWIYVVWIGGRAIVVGYAATRDRAEREGALA